MQIDEYKKQVLASLDHAMSIPCNQMPNYRTMIVVLGKLTARGMTVEVAERVASTARIEVSSSVYEDVIFMDAVTDKFVQYVLNLHEFAKENFRNFDDRFIEMLDGVSLTLTEPT